jgi:hypothetical protein
LNLSRVILILLLCGLTGCATPRTMDPQLEALVNKNCVNGCAVVPFDLWEAIRGALAEKGIQI